MPTFECYAVGIVTPAGGVNEAQLAECARLLRLIEYSRCAERIAVLASPPDLMRPGVLPHQLARELQYKAKFDLLPAAYDPSRMAERGAAEVLWASLVHGCDEVWCLAGENEGRMSKARCSSLWRLAQRMLEHGNPRERQMACRVKLIPAWVSMPDAEEKTVRKFGRKKGAAGPRWRKELEW